MLQTQGLLESQFTKTVHDPASDPASDHHLTAEGKVLLHFPHSKSYKNDVVWYIST